MPSISLRSMNDEDQYFVVGQLMDPKVCQYLPFDPLTREQANKRFQEYLQYNQENPPCGSFVVTNDEGHPLGYGFIRPFRWELTYEGLEVGILVCPEYWGRKIASQLASLGSERLKDSKKVYAIINDHNIASRRIVAQMGFKKIAPSEKYANQSIWSL